MVASMSGFIAPVVVLLSASDDPVHYTHLLKLGLPSNVAFRLSLLKPLAPCGHEASSPARESNRRPGLLTVRGPIEVPPEPIYQLTERCSLFSGSFRSEPGPARGAVSTGFHGRGGLCPPPAPDSTSSSPSAPARILKPRGRCSVLPLVPDTGAAAGAGVVNRSTELSRRANCRADLRSRRISSARRCWRIKLSRMCSTTRGESRIRGRWVGM